MAQQPQGKHMEVKHMGDSDKKRRATILKGVFVVLLLSQSAAAATCSI